MSHEQSARLVAFLRGQGVSFNTTHREGHDTRVGILRIPDVASFAAGLDAVGVRVSYSAATGFQFDFPSPISPELEEDQDG